MRVRFWGTRGSIAKPGTTTVRYGGNTSCVEVCSNSGTLVVLDCGTGAHGLGIALTDTPDDRPRVGHILVTHTHWDHIQGFPFFAPLFRKADHWQVYGPRGLGPTLRETFSGQMNYTYFPVSIDQLQAKVEYRDLVEGSFDVGDIHVSAQYLNHPSLTLGYRLEVDDLVVVYATDHEPHARELAGGGRAAIGSEDENHVRFCENADLLIHDTQYTVEEYPHKVGWGHSTIEYAVDSAIAAGVKTLALFHHDPLRDDAALDALLQRAISRAAGVDGSLRVIGAAEGESLTLQPGIETRAMAGMRPAAVIDEVATDALQSRMVVVAAHDSATRELLIRAASADGVTPVAVRDTSALLDEAFSSSAALVLMEHGFDSGDTLEICQRIRGELAELPLVVVAAGDEVDLAAGRHAGISDWLVMPCSPQYARSRIQAWLLRAACRWERAPLPVDEQKRLASLHRLGLLDTRAEERFDRYTRIAAALFNVPVALVSLVDSNRQWFKSRLGMDASETHRDMAFCAHAIVDQQLLLVEDALDDRRFADNPLVTDQHVRFYAGTPLTLSDGSRVGTLCVMDHRPRLLDDAEQKLLRDLGNLVERELYVADD